MGFTRRYAYDRYRIYIITHAYECERSHNDSHETQYRDTRFVYLGNDTFRTETDETLKQMATFTRYATRDTSITVRLSRYTYLRVKPA